MYRRKILSIAIISTLAFANSQALALDSLNSSESSVERSNRIIGGSTAPAEKWPFMAALVSKGYNGGKGQFCGPSFIGSRYVLTAAHCLDATLGEDIEVIIGQQNLSAATSEQRLSVRKVYIHEEYADAALGNDIAILELSEEFEGAPVALVEASFRNSLAAGTNLTVMGWGDQDPTDNFRGATQLQQVNVELIDQQVCKNVPALGYDKITENAFCAGVVQGGKDSCQGDSGGPIVVSDNGQYKQLGIVSWGDGCAEKGKYGVYANVSYYADWIANKTKGLSYDQHVYAGIVTRGSQTVVLTYQNNTESELTLSNLRTDQGVTVDNRCTQPLPAGHKCEVEVSYNVVGHGNFSFDVAMDSSQGIGSVNSKVHYQSYPAASSSLSDWVKEQVPNQQLTVFSQANGWQRTNTGIVSSGISHNQYSTFAISGIAKGQVALDLAVSSEEDFDELKVFVNERLELSVSGEQEGTVSFLLPREKNVVELVYVKDELRSEGEDRGFLNAIRYSSSLILPSTESSSSGSSSGGSLGWLSLFALLGFVRRKH
ncbi:serine protease [Vibrio vulnificus]|uniref:S1 family peptidase n=1 Tax=Vibrio vulnificus TaxID=672 RepID=UPI000475B64D|nr:serine protease [Vibrio vulnificus]KFK59854.1 serine protease [Vibrio vulnificus]KFK64323.1 serine protease [Vibrio vulnificus]KFK70935.1 serine protease [Vibrio vulnificus]NHE83777.1 serine protease [Vibrio vulnificus]POC56377.1 serine protease [Vibrio vulnificus]